MRRIIVITLYILTALIPLIFTTSTYELFEFPKFIVLLSGVIVISIAWLIYLITTRDFILAPDRPRYLRFIDWSVIAVLVTQTASTLFSIHPYTSFWGYYSRFHQGLLTTILYSIIYFAAVKWLDKKSFQKIINISIKTSLLIGLIAILEHYNFSITCIIMTALAHFQNAQNGLIASTACWGGLTNPLYRSFATLGQPNWLAAYLIPNMFLLLYQNHHQNTNLFRSIIHYSLFIILFLALLFTGSRSGFLAFAFAFLAYWVISLRNFPFSKLRSPIIRYSSFIILVALLFGTPFTPSLFSYYKHLSSSKVLPANTVSGSGTVLETGGTNSGEIRKIVWSGALQLVKQHPLLGTGPETFAYTYYWARPVAHNYTSESDYLYNKAHNEYLNFAATTGLVGLAGYLFWHFAMLAASLARLRPTKKINKENENNFNSYAPVLAAGVLSFAVTNFFGFSVIPVYFLMTLLAAFPSIVIKEPTPDTPADNRQYMIALLVSGALIVLFPGRFLLADIYFNRGKTYLSLKKNSDAINLLTQAVALRPSEDLFHSYLGEAYAAAGNVDKALQETVITRTHNPYHLNYYKSRTKVYIALADQDPSFYKPAIQELEAARRLAPTDPKLAYNLGLIYSRTGDLTNTEKQMYQAIELKKDYQEPYYAMTLIYEETKHPDKIPALLQTARENLATYSGLLKEKIDKYSSQAK